MASKSSVLLVTKESETKSSVLSALQTSGRLEPAGVCPSLHELVAELDQDAAHAALIDIDPQPDTMLKDLERISMRFASTRFVVLSSELRNELVLEAMQAGARHFVLKHSISSDLEGVLRRLLPNVESFVGHGSVISVFSVSGGCGGTTLAINLANEMQLATSAPALVVDMDVSYGSVASYLGLKGEFGIADVLASPDRIDAEFVHTTAVSHSEKLFALVSPASINLTSPTPLAHSHLSEALKACKDAYGHTVVDAPRVSMEVAATLAGASKVVVVVFQLTVKDLRMARATCAALEESGVPREKIVALANRFRKRGEMISLEEARNALPEITVETASNDYRSAILGLNYGQPLAQAAPRSLLRRDIQRLSAKFANSSLTRSS